jgi:hypothetical protein
VVQSRNKKSVTCDPRRPEWGDRAPVAPAAHRIENFRAGALEKRNLG